MVKKHISFFLFFVFTCLLNLTAKSNPFAHLSVDLSSILEDGGSTKVRVTLKDNSDNIVNAATETNIILSFSGTATEGVDYSVTSNTITIPVGESQGFITLNSIDDNLIDDAEEIVAEIVSISAGAIDPVNADRTITILDDDLIISLRNITGDTVLLEEGEPQKTMRVELNQPAPVDVTVLISIVVGTADINDILYDGFIKIDDGDTFTDFTLNARDDNVYEDSVETFYMKIGSKISGPGTIENDSIGFSVIDNEPPQVTFFTDPTNIAEDGGSTTLLIILSRAFNQDSKIGLNYEGQNFSAEKDVDFSSDKSDLVTIPAGDTVTTLTISSIDDLIQDPNEEIIIELNDTDPSSGDNPLSENITFGIMRSKIIIDDDENPPVPGDDFYHDTLSVDEGDVLIINDSLLGLLPNDFDPEGTPLSISLQLSPNDGVISCAGVPNTICANGTFEYTHDAEETPSGFDNFSYTITDADGFSAIGQVSIQVNQVNDCPRLLIGAEDVDEGETYIFDLKTETLDPEYAQGIDLDLTYLKLSDPPVGTLNITPEGIMTYVAPPYLNGGSPVFVDFDVRVTDGFGCPDEQTVTIQITNTVPQAVADTFVVGVGGTLTIPAPEGVLSNDPVPFGSASVNVTNSPNLAITSGDDKFVLNPDGSFTYTHDGSPSPKVDTFSYRMTITYEPGITDASETDVFIKVNDCPITAPDFYTVFEGGQINTSLLGLNTLLDNDTDPNGDPLEAYLDLESETDGSTVTVDKDGNFIYTHGGGEDTEDVFTYYAWDGLCQTVDTVKITIIPRNDCPETRANGYNSLSLLGGAPIRSYIENLTDEDGNPLNLSIDSVRIDASGDTLLVYSSDGDIWVLGMDEGGILQRDSLSGALLTDTDPDGDYIFMKKLLPGDDNWILDANGDPVYPFPAHAVDYDVNADGSFFYEHDGSGNVRDVIYVEVCDVPQTGEQSCCVLDSINLFFGPDNACAQGQTDYFTVNEGGSLVADEANLGFNKIMDSLSGQKYTGVLLNDYDEEGDILEVTLNTLPTYGVIQGGAINADGSFTYVHDGGEQTSDSFTYIMGDNGRECAEVTVYINIISVNDCPDAIDTIYTVDEGGTLIIDGVFGGGSGHFVNLPGIMGNDIDTDVGSTPQITDNLIAFYSMSEYYDSIDGPGFLFELDTLPSILVLEKLKDQSSNEFHGSMKGGIQDTILLPNPPGCADPDHGGKCESPPSLIYFVDAPKVVNDRFQPPKQKNSMEFDGVNSYVEVENQILDLSSPNYTISGWFRSFNGAAANSTILNFTINGNEEGLKIGIENNKLAFGVGNGNTYSVKPYGEIGGTNLNNQWNHYVFIKNGDNYKMYLNKNEIYSQTLNNASLISDEAQLLIGKSISGGMFDGRMDELYIFSDVISEDEILKLYYGISTGLINDPEDGVLTEFNVDGSFTYIHSGKDNDFDDNFVYQISDGACTDLGIVRIVINPVNDCPVAVNDTINVDEGGTVTINAPGVLINDYDVESDPIEAEIVEQPRHGLLVGALINPDGSFTYVHDDSETQIDSLRYIVKESGGDPACTDTATVYININPIADCPIPADDTYYVIEGDVLEIDSCVTEVLYPGSNNENWAPSEPNSSGDENIGEIYGIGTGNVIGTWNDEDETRRNQQYLFEYESIVASLPGFTKIGEYDGHTYFISDQSFLWNNAKADAAAKGGYLAMLKTVEENDAVAAMLPNGQFHFGLYQDETDPFFKEPEGGWKWIDGTYLYDTGKSRTLCGVLLNDDTGGADTLFVSQWDLPINGVLTNNEIKYDGKFTYTHNGSQLGDTIKYKIESDLCESDAFANIIIIPINVNDCPDAVRDTFYIDEGGTLDTLGVLLNDFDVDGDVLRAEKDSTSLNYSNHGITSIFPNGRLLYQHDGSESTIDSVRYKAIDPTGCESISEIIIIINSVNDIPVSVEDRYSVFEGDTLDVIEIDGILSNDADSDIGSSLTALLIQDVSVGELKCPSTNADGICADGSFRYIHDGSDTPNEVCFTYRAYDGVPGPPPGFSNITQVCIDIINRLPDCGGEEYSILEGEVIITDLTNGVLSNCTDPDPKDTLTVIPISGPGNGTFELYPDGTFFYDHDCSDNPNEVFFSYYITDGEDTSAVKTSKINILNECPIGNDDLYDGIDEGGTLNISSLDGVLSNDSDQNSCDILKITKLDDPLYGTLDLKPDGSFDYIHDDSDNFEDTFTYLLTDGECKDQDTVNVTIRINPLPDTPPVAVADSFPCIDEGDFIQALLPEDGVLSNDYDLDTGQTLTVTLVDDVQNGVLILNPNGTFIYTHDGGETTSDSFTYYVTDSPTNLTSNTVTVTLCINPVNDCPEPSDDVFTINEGDIIDSTLTINDFDVEGDELLINILSPPTIGGFTWNQDGSFVYTAPQDVQAPGPQIVTFNYILSDATDRFAFCDSIGTVTISINYENDCPVVQDDSIVVDGSVPSSRIINVLNNDYDIDSQIDTTSVTIISGPNFGNAISNINGTISYSFEESPIPYDTIVYSVRDFEGCERTGSIYIYIENLKTPRYQLPNYFTPNGDDFNDFFLIKYENILIKDMSFEVKIFDRYQRLVNESFIQSSDKIWDGMNIDGSDFVKTDFYFYEITPVEYYDTPYIRRRDKLIGTIYLEKER